jgi:hypothetical protein
MVGFTQGLKVVEVVASWVVSVELGQGHDVIHLIGEAWASGALAVGVVALIGVEGAAHPHVGLAADVGAVLPRFAAGARLPAWCWSTTPGARAGGCIGHGVQALKRRNPVERGCSDRGRLVGEIVCRTHFSPPET